MPLREDLLTPIPGDNPSGVNLRYDPVTDKIKEARREDIEAPQGQWQHELKVADWPQVIKLAGEVIATKGKDLQLAVWLVEAHVRREGFSVLPSCLTFLRGMLEQFWDTLYPEIEDDDMEMRAAPLEWLGSKFAPNLRNLPITSNGLSWFKSKEARTVGYEAETKTQEAKKVREQLIKEGKITPEEFDQAVKDSPKSFYENLEKQLDSSLAELQSLIEYCDSKFGDQSPSLIDLRSTLEEIRQSGHGYLMKKGGPTPPPPPPKQPVAAAPVVEEAADEAATEQAAQPAKATAPAKPAAPSKPTPPPPSSEGGDSIDPVSVEDAWHRLAAIARFLRKKDQYAIGPYLMLRGFRWGEIRYNGPKIDPKMLESPPAELRAELKKWWLDSKWDKVLETTETIMELPCARGWLDPQRYAVKALEKKGPNYAFVASAIRTELQGLLEELPGLLEMTMLDDTPTANPETQEWIRAEVLRPVGEAAPAAPAPSVAAPHTPAPAPPPVPVVVEPPSMEEPVPAGDARPPDAFELAMEAVRSGRQKEAIEILSRELAMERSGRGRFKRKMQIAHLFMASGRSGIAHPILEELVAEIDHRKLEEWEEGEVLAHPLGLFLQCLKTAGNDPEKKKQIYTRICRLDPAQALNLSE